MGNWHCIDSSCAEVVYREYLPPSIRWKYDNEPWQEIEGDDYTLDVSGKYDTKSNLAYTFRAKAVCSGSSPPEGTAPTVPRQFVTGEVITVYTTGTYDGFIYNAEKINNGTNANVLITHLARSGGNLTTGYCEKKTLELPLYARNKSGASVRVKNVSGSFKEPYVTGSLFDIEFIPVVDRTVRTCINPINNDCTFTITKNGQVVYKQFRSSCPQVEKLFCRLSDQKHVIQIGKLPYLERIEIRNQSIEEIYLPPAEFPILDVQSLPNQCLNVYRTYITAPPFLSDYVALPGVINPYKFITQICSAPGCPPPEYQVICDCVDECESCPEGTRAVICDDIVCCYDHDGKSVLNISLNNYCGGDTCE